MNAVLVQDPLPMRISAQDQLGPFRSRPDTAGSGLAVE